MDRNVYLGSNCLVIQKTPLDFYDYYLQCKSMVEYIMVCPLRNLSWTKKYISSLYFNLITENNILIPNVAEKNILILVEEKIIWFRVFII
jgi:hypothetical protein